MVEISDKELIKIVGKIKISPNEDAIHLKIMLDRFKTFAGIIGRNKECHQPGKKIMVNGHILDVSTILRITPVEDVCHDWISYNAFYPTIYSRFDIIFINEKPRLEVALVIKNEGREEKDSYLAKGIGIHRKVADFRDKLIEVWSANQLDIPTFNLESI